MNPEGLTTDREVLSSLTRESERVFYIRKRLPDFVFSRRFAKYWAIEYAYIYGERFGTFLSNMSDTFKDESVYYMTLDPDPHDYYSSSHFYGLVSFKASDVEQRYVSVTNPVRSTSRILAGANVGVFWGSSLKWGIMGDRVSWEMAVIGADESIDIPRISGFRCMDRSSLSTYVRSQYHAKDPSDSIASDFMERFLGNYTL